jgi:hypothetical protein
MVRISWPGHLGLKKKKKKTQFCLCKIFECVMEYSSLFRMKKKLSSMWAWEINVHCIVYKKKPIRLTGCLVSPGISYGTRKLTRIPRIKKKKRKKKLNSASVKSLNVSWNIPTCSGWRKNSQACGLERTTSTALYIRKTWENNVHS